jgi:hypothetical protein
MFRDRVEANEFRKQVGFIRYSRGVVTILDVLGLERRSYECYRFLKEYLCSNVAFDPEQPRSFVDD